MLSELSELDVGKTRANLVERLSNQNHVSQKADSIKRYL